jgi:hypothetical protein
MNWKIIIAISTLGIVIGIGLVLGFIHDIFYYRLSIIIILSLLISINIDKNKFINGFIAGFIIECVPSIVVFIFFSTFSANSNIKTVINAKYFDYFMLVYGILTGIITGIFIGFLSWLIADLKFYIKSIKLLSKKKKGSSLINVIFYIIASFLSFFASLYFLGLLLSSCSGHPPFKTPINNILIIIASVLLTWIFYRLGKLFLKASYNSKLADNSKIEGDFISDEHNELSLEKTFDVPPPPKKPSAEPPAGPPSKNE